MSKFRAVLRRHWILLTITTLLGVVAGVVSSQFVSAEVEQAYTAQQVVIANPNSGSDPLIPQDALKVTRGEVPVRAAELFEESQGRSVEPDRLAVKIDTEYDKDSSSLTISSDSTDTELAQARVAAFTQAFLEVANADLQAEGRRQIEQLEQEKARQEAELAEFDNTYPALTQPGATSGNDPAIQQLLNERTSRLERIASIAQDIRKAEQDLSQVPPYASLGPERPRPASSGFVDVPASPTVRAGLLGVVGLLLGGVVTMIIERVNRRVDTREELVDVTDIPILAEIGYLPRSKRQFNEAGALLLDGVWAEPYRRVRSAIQFVQATRTPATSANGSQVVGGAAGGAGETPRVFLVTSTAPGEGKSTTTALTAEALAEVNQPTLVIGGDFRRPEVDHLLGVPREPSLHDMAQLDTARATVDEVVHRRGDSTMYVAPAGKGTREVSRLIGAAREVAEEGRRRGATVLIDSSPLQAANDPVDLLPVVDYVILVVRAGRTTESGLLDGIETLKRMNAGILGIVLIGTPASGRRQTYYYDYYSPTTAPVASDEEVSDDAGPSGGPLDPSAPPRNPAGETADDSTADSESTGGVPVGVSGRSGGSSDEAATPRPGETGERPPMWRPHDDAERKERPSRSGPGRPVTPPPFRPPSPSS